MVEKETFKITSARDLVRAINGTFDENVIIGGGAATGSYLGTPSSGTPVEVMEAKGRLFDSIMGIPVFAAGAAASGWVTQENVRLLTENYDLRQRIQAIEERLANIEVTIPKERVIILREISKEEAKEEIRNLFSTGRTIYYSDIAKELSLDLEMVVDVCSELQKSGEIGVDADIS